MAETKAKPTILLVGLGHLGGVLLEFLAREDWVGRIVACTRDSRGGEARCNLARLSAAAQGLSPWIEYRQTDISDPHRFAETLDSVSPQLVIGTATMQTWWLPELLPPAARASLLEAKFGMWLPLHLSMTHDLMIGIQASSYQGPVLTAPFPDVVNCVLGRIGLAPTCGIGNVDEMVTKIRMLAAQRLETEMAAVGVVMVAHHALESAAFGDERDRLPPYFLRVLHEGEDVTDAVEAQAILSSPYPIPGGPGTAFFTAGSTTRLVRALFDDPQVHLHAPSPGGLPGGYPILAAAGQVQVAPIPGLELQEAIAINEQSHPYDGIQRIEADGTTVFNPESVEIMHRELGYDCPSLSPGDARQRGDELKARFAEYAARHGVGLDRLA